MQKKLVAAIRDVWTRYDTDRRQVKDNTKVYVPTYKKDGTKSKKYEVWYQCPKCQRLFKERADIHIHHIVEVGETPIDWPLKGEPWGRWLERLFCGVRGLKALCKECHLVGEHGKELPDV